MVEQRISVTIREGGEKYPVPRSTHNRLMHANIVILHAPKTKLPQETIRLVENLREKYQLELAVQDVLEGTQHLNSLINPFVNILMVDSE